MQRYYRTAQDSYGDPPTGAWGRAIKRALPKLFGHPAPVAGYKRPHKNQIGRVIAPMNATIAVVSRRNYFGILPLGQQPIIRKPNPWSDKYGGR